MKRLWTYLQRHPWRYLFAGAVVAVIAAGAFSGTYALWAQPDPQILSMPMKWQREAEPTPNTGQDAAGRTLDQHIAAGLTPDTYQPVRKTTFKAGESLWTLRYECFLYKTQDGMVSRAFLGGDGKAGTSASVYTLPDVQIPTRTDGCAVKNHRTPIPADLPPGQWRYQPVASFWKSPIQPSVRVHFKAVVIEVTR